MAVLGKLHHSKRSYYWLFVWAVIISIWTAGIVKRGATYEIWIALALASIVFGYLFFIDISHRISWTENQIWWRGWDYLSIKPMRHTVRVEELTKVVAANQAANWALGRPFDRILLVSPSDSITILPSFHQREGIEELLHLIHSKRPEAFVDPQVTEFMDGGFADWWRYR
jgi:hypothetical protein